jgi:phosphoglycolate phosphatase-like HAD superfamily hydrolase
MTHKVMNQASVLLKARQIIFWDFDGVIKDSVMVKSMGYEQLFMSYGEEVVEQVNQHHNTHGGISRYEKIPLYLSWAGESAGTELVQEFCERFSGLVKQAVIDSPWVPGVREYLQASHNRQYFVLITATPQQEIEQILNVLDMTRYFREVHGSPMAKAETVSDVLQRLNCLPDKALVVGDSDTDFNAAKENSVEFLLRRTALNNDLQARHQGASFESLIC